MRQREKLRAAQRCLTGEAHRAVPLGSFRVRIVHPAAVIEKYMFFLPFDSPRLCITARHETERKEGMEEGKKS